MSLFTVRPQSIGMCFAQPTLAAMAGHSVERAKPDNVQIVVVAQFQAQA